MEELELPIERLNKFLSKHEFKVEDPMGENFPSDVFANIKVKITGTKKMSRMGDEMTFVTYTLFILNSNPMMNALTNILMDGAKEKVIDNQDMTFYILSNRVTVQLQKFLEYWGLNNPAICTKVVNETNQTIKEGIIMEGKYDGIVRQIVNDILTVFKTKKVGGFSLPEDVRETELYYDYPQFKKEFGVFVNFEQSDDVDTFEVDGDLYYNDETIEILVITNPNSGNEILNDLVNELNEVVRHEIEHIIQYDGGMKRKKEPTDSEKYYSQQHELDAQRAGFKRRARREKNNMETLVRNWFKKYPHKHTLNPEQQERVIQKILSEK